MGKITLEKQKAAIRRFLEDGKGTRRVRFMRDGTIEWRGSPDKKAAPTGGWWVRGTIRDVYQEATGLYVEPETAIDLMIDDDLTAIQSLIEQGRLVLWLHVSGKPSALISAVSCAQNGSGIQIEACPKEFAEAVPLLLPKPRSRP